ncbi:MAG: sulfatase [Deltaproteobacteria bacterium]|nr:sulfatase [Deltaproteobacteria bacterium]
MLLGVVVAAGLAVLGCAPGPAALPDIVLVVIDTLRADHLGSYGHGRAQTPRLDDFAARGTRFSMARATSSWTLPSTASILSGRYPAEHGAERMTLMIGEKQLMMAEMLAAGGYDTAGFSANAAVVTPESGFAQGFGRFDVLERRGEQSGPDPVWPSSAQKPAQPDATADVVTDAALAWVSSRAAASHPYFLYVHYFDPHASYSPPRAYAEKFGVRSDDPLRGPGQALVMLKKTLTDQELATLRALYDAEIAFMDHEVGRLLDGLGFGRRRDVVVVITADHGEEFGDHGRMQHTKTLYEEVLRVPLLIGGGDFSSGQVVAAPVSLVRIFPTIAELARVAPPSGLPGRSLLPVLRGAAPAPEPETVFADLPSGAVHRAAVVDGSWKLVLDHGFAPVLYDLAADAGETTQRNQSQGARATALQKAIGEHNKICYRARAAAPPVPITVEPDRRERLRQLGYVVD